MQRFNISADDKSKDKLELPLIEQSRRNMEIPTLSLFPADNTYETAARLLFLSIKWAKSIPSFLQVRFPHHEFPNVLIEFLTNFVLNFFSYRIEIKHYYWRKVGTNCLS